MAGTPTLPRSDAMALMEPGHCMTREKFDAIVARLTVSARRNPQVYQVKVALLAFAGYAYLGLMLLLALGVLGLMGLLLLSGKGIYFVIKGGWIVLLFAGAILRGLWVRFPQPEGRRVTPEEAPMLFATLDEFRRAMQGPRVHVVLVTNDFNASVVQVPRLGIFGFHRNYLIVGLPFMETMSPAEFKAVLAHEYGHLSSAHGKFNNWIYRQRTAWARIVDLMVERNQGDWVILPFLRRFAPYFNAYSFVLARANEYEADRASVRLTDARTTASALLRSELFGQYLGEKVYPAFHRQAWHAPQPALAWSEHLRRELKSGPAPADLNRWTLRATTRRTDSMDTHPALLDRIAAVGVAPELAPVRGPSSASVLLGEVTARQLHAEFDRRWQEENRDAWRARYEQAQQARKKLADLEARTGWTRLSWDEAWEQAALVEQLRSPDEALPLFQALRARDPMHAGAAVAVGRLLLARGDAGGEALLEGAMQREWRTILDGCDLLYGFHLERGNEADAARYLERYRRQSDKLELAQAERAAVDRKTQCEPSGLTQAQIDSLQAQLREIPDVAHAWVVRKRVEHFPDEPLYIVGFKVAWYSFRLESSYAKLAQRVANQVQLPGAFFAVSLDSGNAWLRRRMQRVTGAHIYRRSG